MRKNTGNAFALTIVRFLVLSIAFSVVSGQTKVAQTTFTKADFKKLRWLEGTWRGTGGGVEPFFERYRFIDDSTIEIDFLTDASLSTSSKKKKIVLVDGRILYGDSTIASRLDSTSIDFDSKNTPFSWLKKSKYLWLAKLYQSTAEGKKLVRTYTLERVK